MYPITGPFVQETDNPTHAPLSVYQYRKGWRQAKPFNLPLPYVREVSHIFSCAGTIQPAAFSDASWNGPYDNCLVNHHSLMGHAAIGILVAQCKNELFEKIVKKVDEKVELTVSLAERRQTISMMEKRLIDLQRFVKAFRHRDYGLMKRYFDPKRNQLSSRAKKTLAYYGRNWRMVSRDIGSAWLEFHFGWEPLVKDIDTCLRLLAKPLTGVKVAVHSRTLTWKYNWSLQRANPYSLTRSKADVTVRANCTCDIDIDSPERVYQSVLGLNNPVLTAYSLIPFSWMFDWVNYLGSYISQFSDLSGYRITSACHNWKVTSLGNGSYEYPRGTIAAANGFGGVFFERAVGIPSVTLTWRPLPKRLSVSRGMTAISLLAQQLLDPKH